MRKIRPTPKLYKYTLIILIFGVIAYAYGYKKSKEKNFPIIVSGDLVIDVNKINVEDAKIKRDAKSLLELYYYYKLVKMDDRAANFWYEEFIEKSKNASSAKSVG